MVGWLPEIGRIVAEGKWGGKSWAPSWKSLQISTFAVGNEVGNVDRNWNRIKFWNQIHFYNGLKRDSPVPAGGWAETGHEVDREICLFPPGGGNLLLKVVKLYKWKCESGKSVKAVKVWKCTSESVKVEKVVKVWKRWKCESGESVKVNVWKWRKCTRESVKVVKEVGGIIFLFPPDQLLLKVVACIPEVKTKESLAETQNWSTEKNF